MKTVIQLLFCCLTLFLYSCRREAPQIQNDFFSYQLYLSNDSLLNFKTLENSKASVFVFLAPDCPLSQSSMRSLNELHAKFANDDVGIYGVVAGQHYDRKEIDGFVTQYRIGFPMALDPEGTLAQFFEATVTPEAIVVNSEGRTVYQGAIDNWSSELGQHRTVITEHYLLDALNSFIGTGSVPVHRTKAVGCFIELGN